MSTGEPGVEGQLVVPADSVLVPLARMETKLDTVIAHVADLEGRMRTVEQQHGADDKARLRDLEARMRTVEGVDLEALKATISALRAEIDEVSDWRTKVMGVAVGIGLASGAGGSILAQFLHI